MRILLLHNRYKLSGGEDVAVLAEKALLEAHGQDVRLILADNDGIRGVASEIQVALEAIYPWKWRRRLDAELASFRPNIVHAHNLFPSMSPSALYSCADAGIPIVQTLHNYRLICPGALLYRDGSNCEYCIGKHSALPGIFHACYRDSRVGTLIVALHSAHHRAKGVSRYIALTEFGRTKLVEGGLPPERIRIKPNFVESDVEIGIGNREYALFVGRLSREKGIDLLLSAWELIGRRMPLKIIGTGPLAALCVQAANRNPAITYLGPKSRHEVYEYMGCARALALPSNCYEGCSLALIEAFAKGTPVIASKTGSMAEMIEHGRTGLHFEPGDPQSLVTQVDWMLSHPMEWKRMHKEARNEYERRYSAARNYEILSDIYFDAINTP